jgi:hypothetical protein
MHSSDMAAKRYQLRLIGHGNLQNSGQHVVRITANGTVDSVDDQIRQLFQLDNDARVLLYDSGIEDTDDSAQQATLIAVSLKELVQGVLDYFQNDMEPSYLATSRPEVLVDAVNGGRKQGATYARSKSTADRVRQIYQPKTWTPLLDKIWPLCIPRCDTGVVQ